MSKASKNENIYTNKISQYLRPVVFEVNPSATDAGIKWSHWRYTFINFLSEECTESTSDATKLKILVNHLSPDVYSYIQNCTNYDTAMTILNKTFLKPKNELHARHILSSRTQLSHESVRDYSRVLQQLSHDSEFKSVSAEQYRCDFIRDTFIAGIKSPQIRQRLLENYTLTLDETLNQAISLEMAEINSKSFQTSPNYTMAIEHSFNKIIPETSVATTPRKRFCFFCGGIVHRRVKCPAVNETCQLCLKKGHFANVCRSNKKTSNAIVADSELPQSLNEELSAISDKKFLMKKNFRASKYEPLTEEVQLLEANPTYSYVRLSDGRETTVSNRRLAPIPQPLEDNLLLQHNNQSNDNLEGERHVSEDRNQAPTIVRHSERHKHLPSYLRDYVL